MKKSDEKKILLRFLKERNIYYKCKCLFINKFDRTIYDIFDRCIGWRSSKEGFKYWYFIQLDFIKLLLLFDSKSEEYNDFYHDLLRGYSHELYMEDSIWKEHLSFYKELCYEF